MYPCLYNKLRGALEAELKDALQALILADPILGARLQSIESNENIEEAIRELLAAEQQALGLPGQDDQEGQGPSQAQQGLPSLFSAQQGATVHTQPAADALNVRVEVPVEHSAQSVRTAAAWRRAAHAALREPLLANPSLAGGGGGEEPLETQHSIDARTRPGIAAMFALGLMRKDGTRSSAP